MVDNDDVAAQWNLAVRRCRRSGASWPDAEDCVQQAWLEALERALPANTPAFAGWLATVSRRRHVDRVRRAATEARLALCGEIDRTAVDPSEIVADQSFAAFLVGSLRALPATTRDVVETVARVQEIEEAAALLGLTRRAVEAHLYRARVALRTAAARSA